MLAGAPTTRRGRAGSQGPAGRTHGGPAAGRKQPRLRTFGLRPSRRPAGGLQHPVLGPVDDGRYLGRYHLAQESLPGMFLRRRARPAARPFLVPRHRDLPQLWRLLPALELGWHGQRHLPTARRERGFSVHLRQQPRGARWRRLLRLAGPRLDHDALAERWHGGGHAELRSRLQRLQLRRTPQFPPGSGQTLLLRAHRHRLYAGDLGARTRRLAAGHRARDARPGLRIAQRLRGWRFPALLLHQGRPGLGTFVEHPETRGEACGPPARQREPLGPGRRGGRLDLLRRLRQPQRRGALDLQRDPPGHPQAFAFRRAFTAFPLRARPARRGRRHGVVRELGPGWPQALPRRPAAGRTGTGTAALRRRHGGRERRVRGAELLRRRRQTLRHRAVHELRDPLRARPGGRRDRPARALPWRLWRGRKQDHGGDRGRGLLFRCRPPGPVPGLAERRHGRGHPPPDRAQGCPRPERVRRRLDLPHCRRLGLRGHDQPDRHRALFHQRSARKHPPPARHRPFVARLGAP